MILDELDRAEPQEHEAAVLELFVRVIDAVEDECSGIPKNPNHHETRQSDGRMYAPHPNFRVACSLKGCSCYRQVAHKTYIAANGAWRIVALQASGEERVILEKVGADGRGIPGLGD